MKRRLLGAGRFGRAIAAIAVGAALLTVAPGTPAHASGNCVANSRDGRWYGVMSIQLMRTSSCTYFARLTIDDPVYGAGQQISWKVDRLELTSYGYFVTETKSRTIWWGGGQRDTGTVEGWYPTGGDDWHHACWRIWDGDWVCTDWMAI